MSHFSRKQIGFRLRYRMGPARGNGFYIADDLGGAAVEARQGFEPMLTLGHNASWIHDRQRAASVAAAR